MSAARPRLPDVDVDDPEWERKLDEMNLRNVPAPKLDAAAQDEIDASLDRYQAKLTAELIEHIEGLKAAGAVAADAQPRHPSGKKPVRKMLKGGSKKLR